MDYKDVDPGQLSDFARAVQDLIEATDKLEEGLDDLIRHTISDERITAVQRMATTAISALTNIVITSEAFRTPGATPIQNS